MPGFGGIDSKKCSADDIQKNAVAVSFTDDTQLGEGNYDNSVTYKPHKYDLKMLTPMCKSVDDQVSVIAYKWTHNPGVLALLVVLVLILLFILLKIFHHGGASEAPPPVMYG
jgi:hypothetical protein